METHACCEGPVKPLRGSDGGNRPLEAGGEDYTVETSLLVMHLTGNEFSFLANLALIDKEK
uniref:Uncharacterized protein n=1 Tax=Nothobranchius kuhntae TaxID=321403 RepID=A0A1A8KXU1_NOTKU